MCAQTPTLCGHQQTVKPFWFLEGWPGWVDLGICVIIPRCFTRLQGYDLSNQTPSLHDPFTHVSPDLTRLKSQTRWPSTPKPRLPTLMNRSFCTRDLLTAHSIKMCIHVATITELRSVTCFTGSHAVYLPLDTGKLTPTLTPTMQPVLDLPDGIEGWADLRGWLMCIYG